jgi:hypothetical protein
MTRPMEAMLVFGLCLFGTVLGGMVGEARRYAELKDQSRLEPVRWVVDAPQRLAIGPFITSRKILEKFDTKSACDHWVKGEARFFPNVNFRPRCIREDGARSVYKPYALRSER